MKCRTCNRDVTAADSVGIYRRYFAWGHRPRRLNRLPLRGFDGDPKCQYIERSTAEADNCNMALSKVKREVTVSSQVHLVL